MYTQSLTKHRMQIHDLPRTTTQLCWLSFCGATAQLGPRTRSLLWSLDHKHNYTHVRTLGRTPLNVLSASRIGRYLHNTQQTQETITMPSEGFEPAVPALEDTLLRPHGHRDRHVNFIHLSCFTGLFLHLLRWSTIMSRTKCTSVLLDTLIYVWFTEYAKKYKYHNICVL
jgi:hypothetical protein